MSQFRSRPRAIFAAFAILALSLAVLGLWAVPNVLSSSTFALVTTFIIGGATVSLLTWRNAQATSTVAQLLHATETGGAQGRITQVNVPPNRSDAS